VTSLSSLRRGDDGSRGLRHINHNTVDNLRLEPGESSEQSRRTRRFKVCTSPSNIELIFFSSQTLFPFAISRSARCWHGSGAYKRPKERQEAIEKRWKTEISIITFCKCVKILCKARRPKGLRLNCFSCSSGLTSSSAETLDSSTRCALSFLLKIFVTFSLPSPPLAGDFT
jgi:hypothetical protein